MEMREEIFTLREVMQRTKIAPYPRVWCGERMPTAKQLLRSETPVVARSETSTQKIIVYESGYFSYSSARRNTVQRVHACKDGIIYRFADGCTQRIEFKTFADLPFTIWMTLEGEQRLEQNLIEYEIQRQAFCDFSSISDEQVTDELNEVLNQMALVDTLSCLTDRQRRVVTAYYMERKSQQQIAKDLHVSQQAVQAQLQAALRKLRDPLLKNFSEESFR